MDSPRLVTACGLALLRLPHLPSAVPPDRRELVQAAGGAACAALAQDAAAVPRFEELLRRYPQTPNLHYGYGAYLLRREDADPPAALEQFEKEIAVDPGAVYARLEIAYELIRDGKHARALPYAEQAVKLAPGLFAAHNALGRALFETGQTARGIAELEKAVQLAPESQHARANLAAAYVRSGRKAEADRERDIVRKLQAQRGSAPRSSLGREDSRAADGGRPTVSTRVSLLAAAGLAGGLLLSAPAAAEPPAPEPPAGLRRDVFEVDTEVVLLDVVVRDRKGRTVRDLKPGELEVYEDGVRQTVGNFRFLDSRAIGEALEDEPLATTPPAAAQKAALGAGSRREPPPQPGDAALRPAGTGADAPRRARPRCRSSSSRTGPTSTSPSSRSARAFAWCSSSAPTARPRAAPSSTPPARSTPSTRRPPTAWPRPRTRPTGSASQLETVTAAGFGSQAGTGSGAVAAAYVGQEVAMADMVVNALRFTDTLQREQQGHSSLFSILSLAKQQQPLAGRKTILFFSEGIQAPPTLEHVLSAAISEANRANVSVYAVDARGLSTVSDSAAARKTLDEAVATSMRQQMLSGFRPFTREEMLIADTAESSLRMNTNATLEQLAESTGGLMISRTNDVRSGIARAVGDLRGYYEVAYSPSNREFDGHFRKITLKVNRPGVAVQTRSGYFAMPPGEGTATFAYEVQLLRAMRSSEPPRDLPVREKLFRFGPEPGGQRYTLVLELPLQAVQFERDQDPAFERAHFSFMGVLRTSWGSVAQKFSQDAPLWLPRQRHDELKQGNAVFMRSFTLPEGRYRMETAAMDRQTGRTSVEQEALSGAPGREPRAEQPGGGQAHGAGRQGRSGFGRPLPGRRRPHRPVGDRGRDRPLARVADLLRRLRAGRRRGPAGRPRVPPRRACRRPCRAGAAGARRGGPHPVRRQRPGRPLRAGPIRGSRGAAQRPAAGLGALFLPGGAPRDWRGLRPRRRLLDPRRDAD